MKIHIHPFHRGTTWLCVVLCLLAITFKAQPKPIPKNEGGGCAIGVAMLVCGGVIVYCLIRTCRKVFDTNSPPTTNSIWTSNQPCFEIVLPCPGEATNQSFIRSGVLTMHELHRTTNLVNWDMVDTQYGEVDELYFYDYDPPRAGATYRLVSW